MTIIIAANDIDVDLGALAEQYDRAKTPTERDQVAEQTYALIGPRIKAMIKRIGRGLSQYDLDGFFGQNEVEFAVGNFLAQHPKPSRQDIDLFTSSLPNDMAGDIDGYGWNNLTLAVDKVVLDAIRDPGIQAEMMRALNASPAGVMALVDGVRRIVLCRVNRIIVNAGIAGQAA